MNRILFIIMVWLSSLSVWSQTDGYNPANPPLPDFPQADETTYHTLKVMSSPMAQNVLSTSGGRYQAGQTVYLYAYNSNSMTFQYWIDDEGTTLSTSRSINYVMPDRDATLTAVFKYQPANPSLPDFPEEEATTYTLRLTAKPAGAGSFNADGVQLSEGAQTHIYAYTNSNFRFLYWADAKGDTVSTAQSFYFTMPAADTQLFAIYKYDPANPKNPGRNDYDSGTGEVIVDDFTPGNLSSAISEATGGNTSVITKITVAGRVNSNDFSIANNYSTCAIVDLSRTTGVTTVPSYCYNGNTHLVRLLLPASISRIEYYALRNATALTELTCMSAVPPTLGNRVLEGVTKGLTVYVPASSVDIYETADGWKDYVADGTIIVMPVRNNVADLEVNLPDECRDGRYKNMTLELVNVKSGRKYRYVVTDRTNYTFSTLTSDTRYVAMLKNRQGAVLARTDTIRMEGESQSVSFAQADMKQLRTVTLKVMAGNEDAAQQCTVAWTAADGTFLAQGQTLDNQVSGTKVKCSVTLPQTVAMEYVLPKDTLYEVVEADNELVVTLYALPKMTLRGKVVDRTTQLGMSGITVTVSQTLNGMYSKAFTAKTDNSGNYTVEAFAAPTTVSYTSSDYVTVTNTLADSLMSHEVVTLDDVAMKPVTGAKIKTVFSYAESVAETVQPEVKDYYADYNNVAYAIRNETAQRDITKFSVQYPNIVLLEEAGEGDSITVVASSKNGAFMDITTGGRIGSDNTVTVSVPVVQLGGIQASFTTTENPNVIAVLYDAAGNFISKYNYTSSTLRISDLKDGEYTLVTMGESDFFGSVYNVAQFGQAGLVNAVDYVANNVTVRSGIYTPVKNAVVPFFDESKFYYTGANTSFSVNKNSIVAGNYLTFTAKVDFKSVYRDNVSDVKLRVELPEGTQLVDNSIMVGSSIAFYEHTDNAVIIPLDNNTAADRVRFCVIPTVSGNFAPNATVAFTLKEKQMEQPIGSAQYKVQDISINVQPRTRTREIVLSGVALSRSEVSIYDGDEIIGTTKALANGYWSATCELKEAYNLTEHEIYAKVYTASGMEMTTETKSCVYDETYTAVKSVKMSFYTLGMNYDIVWDFERNTTTAPSYSFAGSAKFTFVAKLEPNNSDIVKNVVVNVFTNSNNVVEVPCTYNASLGCWIGSHDFNTSSLPSNVSVDYDVANPVVGDRSFVQDCLAAVKANLADTKDEISQLKEMLNPVEKGENSELYDELQDCLENDGENVERIKSLVDRISGETPEVEVDEDFYDNIDNREAKLTDEFAVWEKSMATGGVDDLLMSFGINTAIENLEFPEGNLELSKEDDGKKYTVKVSSITSVDEASLLEQGYVALDMNDGTKIYYKQDVNGAKYIDSKTLKVYEIAITDATAEANAPKQYRSIESINSWTNCLSSMTTWTKRLLENMDASGVGGAESGKTWRDNASLILDIKDALCCVYEKALVTAYTKLNDALAKANTGVDGKIASWQENVNKGKALLVKDKAEVVKLTIANAQIDLKISNNSGNAELVAALTAEKEANLKNIARLEKQMARTAKFVKNIERQLEAFKKARTVAQNTYNIVKRTLDKLPKVPVKQKEKLGKWTKVGGKLIGGFGVFLECLSMYDDLCNAADDVIQWANLLDAINAKIPCEGNEVAAIALRDNIVRDGWGLIHNYARIFAAEGDAIAADCLSLATWNCPPFELGLWLVSGAINGYAECSKYFSIERKYLTKLTLYWMEVARLKCGNRRDDPNKKDPKKPTHPGVTPIVDPSGFVYEGVQSNRLQGVTATCYYKETVEDMYGDLHENTVLWNAEEYAQKNPLFTDENGMYQWDVPQGLWQVKFEKEGYVTAKSEWLPVPPPQMDVNIGMVQNAQPEVIGARAYEDGVEIEFSKYMDIESLTADNIRLKVVKDNEESLITDATIEMMNAEPTVEGSEVSYASKVRLATDRLGYYDEAYVIVSRNVSSYAGMSMAEDYEQKLDVEKKVREIVADQTLNVAYEGETAFTVAAQPAEAAAGKKLLVASASDQIASVDVAEVTFDADGHATFNVKGNLLGATALKLTLEDNGMETVTLVNVVDPAMLETVKAPRASRISGTAVYRGQTVALATESEGATIYYTTDGSCPCDAATRIKYERPIVINGPTTIKAMAVGISDDESDVETYEYTIRQSDVKLALSKGWNWNSHDLASPLAVSELEDVATRILTQTREAVKDNQLGFVGNLENVAAEEAMKVAAADDAEKAFSGEQYNPTATAVYLHKGWNWLGYPVSTELTLADALSLLDAEDDDCIETLDGGFATYSDGEWTGELKTLKPGHGYLYKSASDKSFVYNTVPTVASAKAIYGHRLELNPAPCSADKHQYPNMMPVVAQLECNGASVEGRFFVVAMSGGECRGVGKVEDGIAYLSVYGDGSEAVRFVAVDAVTGDEYSVRETVAFTADMLGTVKSPYVLHIGEATGIGTVEGDRLTTDAVYGINGVRVKDATQKGVYIMKAKDANGSAKMRKRVVR